ncbi:MAG: DUF5696 domain-containing protein [Kiritimatiellia bacterium]
MKTTDSIAENGKQKRRRALFAAAIAVGVCLPSGAASTATLTWTLESGATVEERIALESAADGERLVLPREKIRARNARRLEIVPDFARARRGESGYWFSPYGVYGEYDLSDGRFFAGAERMPMPMFGWSNPRGSCLAIVDSLKYFVRETVTAVKGEYAVAATLERDLCREPYEDLVIEYHRRPAGVPYADLAKIYRRYQLARGAVRPIRERTAGGARLLEQAVLAPELRIRQAWKPVPSPVLHQTPWNEPEVKAVVSFDRIRDLVDELKRQGVDEAELCLVGWNIGGHDGRWPQYFPAEPRLGGDAGLKAAIEYARRAGYLVVPHGNFSEGYEIADNWSAEATIKDDDGLPLGTRAHSWGGGKPYHICPQRAYEIHTKIMPALAAFGFSGLGYFDVVSICEPKLCRDPRHPCTTARSVRFWGECAALARRELGGFASEGGNDYLAGQLDYALYVYFGDPLAVEREHAKGQSLAKRVVPIWQIVYHGIIASNPFTTTMNATLKDRVSQLKLIEFSGRPCFYFHSKFRTTGTNWMGEEDLCCTTDPELRQAVARIREGYDAYRSLRHLQLEFIDAHEEVSPGVFRTGYANGEFVTVDYNRGVWRLGRRGESGEEAR